MVPRRASTPTSAEAHPDGASVQEFKAVFGNHPAGVAIITADDRGRPAGLTSSSVVPVAAQPALLAFSLSSHSSATPAIVRSDTVVVHLLGAGQLNLAKRFATGGIDRFSDTASWSRLETGEPVLAAADSWLRGRIVHRMEAGSSIVVLAHVVQVRIRESPTQPLVYRNRTWYALDEAAALK